MSREQERRLRELRVALRWPAPAEVIGNLHTLVKAGKDLLDIIDELQLELRTYTDIPDRTVVPR